MGAVTGIERKGKQRVKTSEDLQKIVDKDLHIEVLRDTLTDLRIENRFIKKVVLILFAMLFIAVIGLFAQGIYHQHKMFKFFGENEFNTEIHMDNDLSDSNTMTVKRK